MTNVTNFIGIDISKEYFDVALYAKDKLKTRRYDKDQINKFIKSIDPQSHCVMESTGTYHLTLAHALHQAKITLSVVNPLSAKRFNQSRMIRAKTDKTDAIMLIEYAKAINPAPWSPDPAFFTHLQQLLSINGQLVKQRTAITNQLEAISFSVYKSKGAQKSLQRQLKYIETELEKLDKEMQEIAQENLKEEHQALSSIPGIGSKTALALLVYSRGMTSFESYKQLSSYFGLCPRTISSGTSIRGRGGICKMGMGYIRMLLYMCARSAKKYNRTCKELYERLLLAGKAKKLALIAVANKLLKQAFAIIKNKTIYNPNFISQKFAF